MKKRRIVLPLCLILCALLMFSCQKAEEGSETEERGIHAAISVQRRICGVYESV